MRANPFIQGCVWGGSTSVVTFPQREYVADKPIYAKSCMGWEYLRSNISSTETCYGQTHLFKNVSRVGVPPSNISSTEARCGQTHLLKDVSGVGVPP